MIAVSSQRSGHRAGYDPRYNPPFTAGNFWCSMFGRDSVPGEIDLLVRVIDASHEVRNGALDGLVLRAGVEHLTDNDSPIFQSSVGANTDPSQ